MISWTDSAFIIAAKPHAENGSVIQILSKEHGRSAGLVYGGRKKAALLQLGNEVQVVWKARLAEQLGHFTLENISPRAAALFSYPARLIALQAACEWCAEVLPEHHPYPALYQSFQELLAGLISKDWLAHYIRWEITLLQALGYGLDLRRCAVTGAEEDLIYVSPKSGRAVSKAAGLAYHDKLLALPAFLLGAAEASFAELSQGLELSGYFLHRYLLAERQRPFPKMRQIVMRQLQSDPLFATS
ncbi:MAG: DNA repair protein RecO [Dongiaceae bacterium]